MKFVLYFLRLSWYFACACCFSQAFHSPPAPSLSNPINKSSLVLRWKEKQMLTIFHLFLKIIKNHKKWIFGCLHRLMNANERESGKEGNKKKEQEESRIQSYRLCRSLKNLYFLLPGNINWNSLFSSFFVASSLHIFMIPRLLTNFRRKKRRNEGG